MKNRIQIGDWVQFDHVPPSLRLDVPEGSISQVRNLWPDGKVTVELLRKPGESHLSSKMASANVKYLRRLNANVDHLFPYPVGSKVRVADPGSMFNGEEGEVTQLTTSDTDSTWPARMVRLSGTLVMPFGIDTLVMLPRGKVGEKVEIIGDCFRSRIGEITAVNAVQTFWRGTSVREVTHVYEVRLYEADFFEEETTRFLETEIAAYHGAPMHTQGTVTGRFASKPPVQNVSAPKHAPEAITDAMRFDALAESGAYLLLAEDTCRMHWPHSRDKNGFYDEEGDSYTQPGRYDTPRKAVDAYILSHRPGMLPKQPRKPAKVTDFKVGDTVQLSPERAYGYYTGQVVERNVIDTSTHEKKGLVISYKVKLTWNLSGERLFTPIFSNHVSAKEMRLAIVEIQDDGSAVVTNSEHADFAALERKYTCHDTNTDGSYKAALSKPTREELKAILDKFNAAQPHGFSSKTLTTLQNVGAAALEAVGNLAAEIEAIVKDLKPAEQLPERQTICVGSKVVATVEGNDQLRNRVGQVTSIVGRNVYVRFPETESAFEATRCYAGNHVRLATSEDNKRAADE